MTQTLEEKARGHAWDCGPSPARSRSQERLPSTHRCTTVADLVETWGGQVRWAARRAFYDQWHRFLEPRWWNRLCLADIIQDFWKDVTRYAARYLAADDQRQYLSRAVAMFVTQQVRTWPGYTRLVMRGGKSRIWKVGGGAKKYGITLGEDYDNGRLRKSQIDELLDRTAFDEWGSLKRA